MRRRKWIVVGIVAAAVVGSFVLTSLQDPVYEAEAQMLVEPRAGTNVFGENATLNVANLERAIQTEIQVLEGQQVRERVQQDLGLRTLPRPVTGSPVGSTDVVSVRVRSGDPDVARSLADAYVTAYESVRREQAVAALDAAGEELQAKIDQLQEQIETAPEALRPGLVAQQATFMERLDQMQIDAALTTGGASVVKSADEPQAPVEPKPQRTAVIAGVLGLLVGLAGAFLVDHLDDSVRSTEDVEGLSDVPVLAAVPIEPPPDHRPIAMSAPHQFAVEIYRGLRTNIQFLGLDRPMKVVQVTSSLPSEGKTTTATNLATVLGQAGHRVLLVDADLRKPRVHEAFGVPATPGLTELVLGEPVDMVITRVPGGPDVVTAGTVPPNPSEMIAHPRVGEHLRDLASRYDYVIVDTPPVLPVADALALSHVVDGVLLVAQAGRVSRRQLTETLAKLDRVRAPVLGIVLNRAPAPDGEGGTYGYGYGEAYGVVAEPDSDSIESVPAA